MAQLVFARLKLELSSSGLGCAPGLRGGYSPKVVEAYRLNLHRPALWLAHSPGWSPYTWDANGAK